MIIFYEYSFECMSLKILLLLAARYYVLRVSDVWIINLPYNFRFELHVYAFAQM